MAHEDDEDGSATDDSLTRREFLEGGAAGAAVGAAGSYEAPTLIRVGVLAQPGGGSGCPFPNPNNPNCSEDGTPRRGALARLARAVMRRVAKRRG